MTTRMLKDRLCLFVATGFGLGLVAPLIVSVCTTPVGTAPIQ